MNKNTLKTVFAGVVLALFCGFLLSCTQKSDESVNISFRSTWPEESGRTQALADIINNFPTDENHSVSVSGGNENVQEIITILNSGASNEVMLMPYRYVQSLGEEGYFLNLEKSIDKEIFYPGLLELSQVDGQYYGVPFMGHSMAFIYNKEIVEPLLPVASVDGEIQSIKDIHTWQQFEDLLTAIKDSDFQGAPLGMVGKQSHDVSWMTSQFVYSFGGEILDENNQAGITESGSQEGLAFYKHLADNYGQEGWQEHSGVEVLAAFRSQEVAIEIQGPWGITDIWKQSPENQFEVGAFSLTQIDGGYAEVGPLMLVIPSDIEGAKLDLAKELVAYLVSKEAQAQIMDGEYDAERDKYYPYRIPARNDMEDALFFQENPEFLSFIEGFKRPSIDQPSSDWGEVKTKVYEPALNSYLSGNLSMEELVTTVTEESNKILNP